MLPRVMLSYNSAQRDFANKLKARLRAAGLEVWIDREGIEPGTRWRDGFLKAIQARDVFVPILSPEFLQSSHCRLEVLTARSFGKKIVPVMVKECMGLLGDHPETHGLDDIFLQYFTDLKSVGVPLSEEEAFQRVIDGILFDAAADVAVGELIYVAHVWKQAVFADRIATALKQRGHAVWIAARDIPVGVRWFDEQIRSIHRSRAMVVVIDEEAPNVRHLRTEIAVAGVLGLPLFPVLADTIKGNWPERNKLNAAFKESDEMRPLYEFEPFSTEPDWNAMIDKLHAALPAAE